MNGYCGMSNENSRYLEYKRQSGLQRKRRRKLERRIRPPRVPTVLFSSGAVLSSPVECYFTRGLAVWSTDPTLKSPDAIATLSKHDLIIEDTIDKYSFTNQRMKWIGVVFIFGSDQEVLSAGNVLTNHRVGQGWPWRTQIISRWLSFLRTTEAIVSEQFPDAVTPLSVKNLNRKTSPGTILKLFEKFGVIEEIHLDEVEGDVYKLCVVKFVHASDAYAAQLYLFGQNVWDFNVEATLCPAPKTKAINSELAKKDMVLWS